ncbi:MAG TPA: PAS domain-containing protein [Usitatibacter sp.]|nr:PAS domain-containing protein [Usitatibacter sp.]
MAASPLAIGAWLILVSVIAKPRWQLDSPALLVALNFAFGTALAIATAAVAAAGFVRHGATALLLVAAGAAVWALANPLAVYGAGTAVAMYSLSAWFTSMLYVGAIIGANRGATIERHRGASLAVAWAGAGAGVALTYYLVKTAWIPPFFIEGAGATPVRQIMLGSTATMFALGAVLAKVTRPAGERFHFWFALSLLLFAEGLVGIALQRDSGDAVTWIGWAMQYVGSIYLLVAMTVVARTGPAFRTSVSKTERERMWFILALAMVICAEAVRATFLDPLRDHNRFVTFFLAVELAALYGGAKAGIAATGLSSAFVMFLWMEPRYSLQVASRTDRISLIVFAFTGCVVALFAEGLNRAHERARVAEREAAMRRAREAQARQFRSLAESMPQLAWVADARGRMSWYNRRWYEYTGMTPQRMRDLAWRRVCDRKTLREAARRWRHCIAEGEPFEMVLALRGADGILRPFLSRTAPVKDDNGKVVQWFGTSTDITDMKRAEEALRESEHFVRRVLEALTPFVAVLDREANLLLVNHAPPDMARQQPADAIGLKFWDCAWWSDESRLQLRGAFERALRGERVRYDTVIRLADGGPRWIDFQMAALSDSDGRITHVIASAIDVSERKSAEEQLKIADRRKNEFLATLAHELRNPLGAIRMSAEVVRRLPEGAKPDQALAMMERQIRLVVRLVEDLLDVSRIGRGKLELRLERVDLRRIAQEALESCAERLRERHQPLATSLGEAPIRVRGDAVRLVQVVSNLLVNASKYSPPGREIRLCLRREGEQAVLDVADQGEGIPADKLQAVFDMFMQLDTPAASKEPSLGIGLQLVQQLVEMHGGSVAAQSEGPGHGSRFIVRLPLAPDDSPDDRQPPKENGNDPKGPFPLEMVGVRGFEPLNEGSGEDRRGSRRAKAPEHGPS